MVAPNTLFGLFAGSSVGAALKSSTPKSQLRNIAASGAVIWASGGVNGKSDWRSERIWSARPAAKPSPLNAPMPYIAATPVGRKHTERVQRVVVTKLITQHYLQRFQSKRTAVTIDGIGSNWPNSAIFNRNPKRKRTMLRLIPRGHFVLLALSVTNPAKQLRCYD